MVARGDVRFIFENKEWKTSTSVRSIILSLTAKQFSALFFVDISLVCKLCDANTDCINIFRYVHPLDDGKMKRKGADNKE